MPTNQDRMKKKLLHTELIENKIRKAEEELAKGNFDNYELFLKHTKNQDLDYFLEMAAFYGKVNLVREALEKGANDNASLSSAIQMACRNGHLNVVSYLINAGVLSNIPEANMLIEAAENNRPEVMEYLLSNQNIFGVCLVNVHADYDCAIRFAVDSGHLEMVKLLIKHGANVNIFDGYLLLVAVKKRDIAMAKCLLENGLDKKYVPEAIECAKILNNQEMLAILTI